MSNNLIKKIPLRVNSDDIIDIKFNKEALVVHNMIKTASGLKQGDQRLYANPDEILSKFADFDIVEGMKNHPETFLWCRARAIDADTPNENGDYFSKQELLAEVEAGKKGKIPAFKTFEGVPIYTNHKNEDIEESKGKVVYAEWDEDENCVYCTFFVDAESWPKLARGIREGYIHDVSMGCHVEYSRCSICNNKAASEDEFCSHIKEFKGKKFSGVIDKGPNRGKRANNEPVFEKNYGVKFIELSCVSDGAFENCEIEQILDVEDFVKKTDNAIKTATVTKKIIAAHVSKNKFEKDIKEFLINAMNFSQAVINYSEMINGIHRLKKVAQSMPPSVSSEEINQLIGGINDPPQSRLNTEQAQSGQAPQGAHGGNIVDESNLLDILNQTMLLVEEVIRSLLNMRDRVNMDHVKDLSKVLAEVQQVLGNLIDDGIGKITSQGAVNINLTNPNNYNPNNPNVMQGVGQIPEQMPEQMSVGEIPNYGPTETGVGVQMASKSLINNLKKIYGGFTELQNEIKESSKRPAKEVNKKMERFTKIAANLRSITEQETVETYSKEQGPYKVVISTTGDVTGYYHGQRVGWKPLPTEEQLEKIEDGRVDEFTDSMLSEFKKACAVGAVKVAEARGNIPTKNQEGTFAEDIEANFPEGRLGYPEDVNETYIEQAHSGAATYPMERYLEDGRLGEEINNRENTLGKHNPKYHIGRQGYPEVVNEGYVEQTHANNDLGPAESRLRAKRVGTASNAKVASSVSDALSKSIVLAKVSPREVVEASSNLLKDDKLIDKLNVMATSYHKKGRRILAERAEFGQQEAIKQLSNIPLEDIVAGTLADKIDNVEIGSNDIVSALQVLHTINNDKIAQSIGKLAKEAMGPDADFAPVPREKDRELRKEFLKSFVATEKESDDFSKEDLKVVTYALTDVVKENNVTSDEVLDAFQEAGPEEMIAKIETAMTEEEVESRAKIREREMFFDAGKTDFEQDVDKDNLLCAYAGKLADKALEQELNPFSLVAAIKLLEGKRAHATKVVKTLLEHQPEMEKKAYTVMDRADREFTVRFQLSECGCVANDPDLQSKVKAFVAEILNQRGYQVSDPDGLTFTNLDIQNTGECIATIRSSILRNINDTYPMAAADTAIPPATVLAERKNKRAQLLRKAQAAGFPVAPNAAGGAAMDIGTGGAVDNVPADMGIAGFTGAGGEEEEPIGGAENDAATSPGEIKPPGSICPACGSTDVDLADSQGKCNSCGTEFEVTIDIKILNPNQASEGAAKNAEDELGLEGLGPEGAAPEGDLAAEGAPGAGVAPVAGAAPGAAAPATGMMPPAAPPPLASDSRRTVYASVPLWVKLEWRSSADVFAKTASIYETGIDPAELSDGQVLAVGHICPACSNRHGLIRRASKSTGKTNVFCDKCGTVSVVSIKPARGGVSNIIEYQL